MVQSIKQMSEKPQAKSQNALLAKMAFTNYIYDVKGTILPLDSLLFEKMENDVYKQVGTDLIYHRNKGGERQFVYTDAQGNYCHYNKKGQLIRIIGGISCLVDEYNRNLVSSTIDVPKLQQKFLSPAGIQYQVDNYGNMYTLAQN